jgi:hypothetical protein
VVSCEWRTSIDAAMDRRESGLPTCERVHLRLDGMAFTIIEA